MTKGKPDLYIIRRPLISNYPAQTVEQFAVDIQNGLSPSRALSSFVTSNNCPRLHSSVIFCLLEQAYEGIEIRHFLWIVYDSGYPFGDLDYFSDDDLDKIVIQAYKNPPKW